MTINHEDLIAELRGFAGTTESARASLMRDTADALEQTTARLREVEAERERWASASDVHASRATAAEVALLEAEACIEKVRKHLELSLGASAPMSTTHYILTAYKPTSQEENRDEH